MTFTLHIFYRFYYSFQVDIICYSMMFLYNIVLKLVGEITKLYLNLQKVSLLFKLHHDY